MLSNCQSRAFFSRFYHNSFQVECNKLITCVYSTLASQQITAESERPLFWGLLLTFMNSKHTGLIPLLKHSGQELALFGECQMKLRRTAPGEPVLAWTCSEKLDYDLGLIWIPRSAHF